MARDHIKTLLNKFNSTDIFMPSVELYDFFSLNGETTYKHYTICHYYTLI